MQDQGNTPSIQKQVQVCICKYNHYRVLGTLGVPIFKHIRVCIFKDKQHLINAGKSQMATCCQPLQGLGFHPELAVPSTDISLYISITPLDLKKNMPKLQIRRSNRDSSRIFFLISQ